MMTEANKMVVDIIRYYQTADPKKPEISVNEMAFDVTQIESYHSEFFWPDSEEQAVTRVNFKSGKSIVVYEQYRVFDKMVREKISNIKTIELFFSNS